MTGPRTLARRPTPRRAIVAWVIAAACLIAFLFSLWVWVISDEAVTPDIALYLILPLAFGGVGAALTARVPDNPIGPILLATTIGLAVLVGGQAWVIAGAFAGQPLPGTTAAAFLAGLMFVPTLVLVLVGIPLIFPNGRFLSPPWRWVAVASALAVAASEVAVVFGYPNLMDSATIPNPFYVPALAEGFQTLDRMASVAAVPLFVLAGISVVLRYRRGGDIERRQMRWLIATASVALAAYAISFNAPDGVREIAEGLGLMAFAACPVAIGIAVVRYRLYEIDRIISRTISYGLVTILLVAAYAAVVLVLQGPLGGLAGSGTVSVAISTLVVAALFQPVRRRVQHAVDRRFDRARFDADQMAAAFSERLRADVDIKTVVADLETTAATAVRPVRTGLWLRSDPS